LRYYTDNKACTFQKDPETQKKYLSAFENKRHPLKNEPSFTVASAAFFRGSFTRYFVVGLTSSNIIISAHFCVTESFAIVLQFKHESPNGNDAGLQASVAE